MKVRVYVYQSNDGKTLGVFPNMEELNAFQREEGVPEVEIQVETYVHDYVIENPEVVE